MKRIIQGALILWGLPVAIVWGWGYDAHRLVNGHAVDITPGPLGDFLRAHREGIVALAVEADERKSNDPTERYKHYVDFELFENPPTAAIPLDRGMAEARYTVEGMTKGGTLLWVLPEVVLSLKDALAAGDWDRYLVQAADLGHYLADGHQPLHTTVNFDGQETGNRGVHYMFESVMTERHLDEYVLPTAPLPAIGDVPADIFAWLMESFDQVETIIAGDLAARAELSPELQELVALGYHADLEAIPAVYFERLYKETGALAQVRLEQAAVRLAALWLWAWSEAGSPTPPG